MDNPDIFEGNWINILLAEIEKTLVGLINKYICWVHFVAQAVGEVNWRGVA